MIARTDIPSLLQAKDDFRHRLSGEFGRESLAYVVPLPEEGLGLIAYTWVNAASEAGYAVFVWDKDEVVAFESTDAVAMGDADFDDWRIGGLRVTQTDALRSFDLQHHGNEISFELAADAISPAFAYGDHPLGTPRFMADQRWEQSLLAKGRLQLGSRSIEIDGAMARDHSWGRRDWHYAQHWKWIHVIEDERNALHFWELFVRGRREVRGYVVRDGVMTVVATADVDSKLTAQGVQERVWGTVTDACGVETRFEVDIACVWNFRVHPGWALCESAAWATFEGRRARAHAEFAWPQSYLDHLEAHGADD